ncbi:MAG TPA: hypothetical protein VFJ25_11615, partial [Casimicrobiaceae bacterium]|nr:hypothetical protein [Casimicrobiaceae bacterium]
MRIAHGEHEADALGEQPARDERERLGRHAVEPVRIVDDAEDRLIFRAFGEQAEHGEADEKTIRRLTGVQTERSAERVALRRGELFEAAEHWRAQCMQTCERELRLRLDTGGAKDRATLRAGRHELQERALPGPGFAAQNKHTALARANSCDERRERAAFADAV